MYVAETNYSYGVLGTNDFIFCVAQQASHILLTAWSVHNVSSIVPFKSTDKLNVKDVHIYSWSYTSSMQYVFTNKFYYQQIA